MNKILTYLWYIKPHIFCRAIFPSTKWVSVALIKTSFCCSPSWWLKCLCILSLVYVKLYGVDSPIALLWQPYKSSLSITTKEIAEVKWQRSASYLSITETCKLPPVSRMVFRHILRLMVPHRHLGLQEILRWAPSGRSSHPNSNEVFFQSFAFLAKFRYELRVKTTQYLLWK